MELYLLMCELVLYLGRSASCFLLSGDAAPLVTVRYPLLLGTEMSLL